MINVMLRHQRARVLFTTIALAVTATACPPDTSPPPPGVPANLTRISPNDGIGYAQPRISADGDVVVYRRETAVREYPSWPAELVVTRVSTGTTQRFPDVRDVRALSPNGRYVLEDRDIFGQPMQVLDTTDGSRRPAMIDSDGFVPQVSNNGDALVLERVEVPDPGNPELPLFEFRARVARANGTTVELVLATGPQYGPWAASGPHLSDDGTTVTVLVTATRQIVRHDVATGATTVLPVTVPSTPQPDEMLLWAAPDGSEFGILSGTVWIVGPGQAPTDTGRGVSPYDPAELKYGLTINSAGAGYVQEPVSWPQDPFPNNIETLVVRDVAVGTDRALAQSPYWFGDTPAYRFTFRGAPARSGRAAIGFKNSYDPEDPAPTGAIYIDG